MEVFSTAMQQQSEVLRPAASLKSGGRLVAGGEELGNPHYSQRYELGLVTEYPQPERLCR